MIATKFASLDMLRVRKVAACPMVGFQFHPLRVNERVYDTPVLNTYLGTKLPSCVGQQPKQSLGVFQLYSPDPQFPVDPRMKVSYRELFDIATENGMLPVLYSHLQNVYTPRLSTIIPCGFMPLLMPVCFSEVDDASYVLGIKSAINWEGPVVIRRNVVSETVHPEAFRFLAAARAQA